MGKKAKIALYELMTKCPNCGGTYFAILGFSPLAESLRILCAKCNKQFHVGGEGEKGETHE